MCICLLSPPVFYHVYVTTVLEQETRFCSPNDTCCTISIQRRYLFTKVSLSVLSRYTSLLTAHLRYSDSYSFSDKDFP